MAVGEARSPARDGGAGALEDVVLCESQADYDAAAGRAVIGQALRPLLDALVLTPSEVLHGGRQLRQIVDQRPVVEAALGKVATAQGRLPGQETRQRRAVLQAALDAVVKRARATDALLATVPKHMTCVSAYLANGIEGGIEGAAGFGAGFGAGLARAVLARDLAGLTTWTAKFDLLLGVLEQPVDASLTDAVDEVLGDLLLSAGAVRDLVGAQATAGVTLVRLLDMMLGRISPEPGQQPGQPDRLGSLSQLFGQGRLPAARGAVLERIRCQLRAPAPLNPGQAALDNDQMRGLLGGLLGPDGVAGDEPMAAALTVRYARRFADGGARGLRRAVTAIAESVPDLLARIHYLAAIASDEHAPAVGDEVAGCLDGALNNGAPVAALVLRTPDLVVVRGQLGRAALAVRASALPPASRERLAVRVERAVETAVISGDLLATLQAHEPMPVRQALRLAELVSSGLIAEVRGVAVIRSRLFELMRRPGFESDLAALRTGAAELQRFHGVIDRLRHLPEEPPPPVAEPRSRLIPPDDVTITVARGPAQITPRPVARPPMPAQTIGGPAAPAPALPPSAAAWTVLPGAAPPRKPPAPSPPPSRPAPPPQVRPPAPPLSGAPLSGADLTVMEDAGADQRRIKAAVAAATAKRQAGGGRCPNCFGRQGDAESCPECGHVDGVTPYSAAHLPPGTWLLDRYRTGKMLGQGGFGATYLGWDDRLQIRVAVKEYLPSNLVARIPGGTVLQPFTAEHAASFTKGIRKFLDEARTLARLRDVKEIVGVQDYFEDNATAYLVMELLQGDTMKKYITDQGGRIDYRKALSILVPVATALHAVHEQGLVHRDISPDNIFMTSAGAKLLDFGAARDAATEGGGGLTVILKPGYAPPEQYFSDGRQGPWTDVYALAATLYCAITGKPPADSARRLQQDALVLPSALGIAMPADFEKVLLTGLALRRPDRYPSMKAFLSALSRAVSP